MLMTRQFGAGLLGAVVLPLASCLLDTGGLPGSPSEVSGGGRGPLTSSASNSAASGAGGGGGGGGGMADAGSGGDMDGGGDAGRPPIAVAGDLLVALDAADLQGDAAMWNNHGTLGGFIAMGKPTVTLLGTVKAVQFDGKGEAYVGPQSVPGIEGNTDRSIEIWVNNPGIDSDEETMVSWSERGGPLGTMMSFNYGRSIYWGAVTHWSPDLGWGAGDPPAPNEWHHLAYTYDGTTARIYEDGVEKNSKPALLDTKSKFTINLGAQRYQGNLEFKNEVNGTQLGGSLWIAIVRIHDGALTEAQVKANFSAESARFR
jgi:hypothetical protein